VHAASAVAYLAMVLFVPAAAVAFALMRPALAAATVLLGAALLLPERVGFDLPGIPPVDKYGVGSLCALLGAAVTSSRRLRLSRPGRGIDVFAWLLLLGSFGTSHFNADPLVYGPTVLPALTTYDALSGAVRTAFNWVAPFFIGRALFKTDEDLRALMVAVVIAALLYSPLVLFELRFSPQLHRLLYGFHQHDFIQTVRAGGWRPMVFVYHGLVLAMFILVAALAAVGLRRGRMRLPLAIPTGLAVGWLSLLLVVVRSAGALVSGLVLIPCALFLQARSQVRIAKWLGLVVIGYPALRASGLFPTESLVTFFARFSPDRADSLGFRFEHEDALVQKALERWLFGWGGFGRNRIYTEWGSDISVTDGFWIIELGSGGLVGFVGIFGLLLAPIWLGARRVRRLPPGPTKLLLAALTLIVATHAVDLLPNGLNSTIPLFFAGALAGLASGLDPRHARRFA
jgi:hypothetical protein